MFSFRLQGLLSAVFDVHVLGNSLPEDVHIDKDGAIERMCVCAFLPVRVRELVLFCVTVTDVFGFIMGFLFIFLHVTENILFTHLSLQQGL